MMIQVLQGDNMSTIKDFLIEDGILKKYSGTGSGVDGSPSG